MEISFWKLLLVLLVALLVLGPKQLPKVAETAGRLLGKARRSLHSAQKEWSALSSDASDASDVKPRVNPDSDDPQK